MGMEWEREAVRSFLGTDEIADIADNVNRVLRVLKRLERDMASAKEQLSEFKGQFADFVSDVDAKIDQLVQAQGQLEPEAQTIYDDLKSSLAAADSRVGDADGSDAGTGGVPAEEAPAADAPVTDDGTAPAGDGGASFR